MREFHVWNEIEEERREKTDGGEQIEKGRNPKRVCAWIKRKKKAWLCMFICLFVRCRFFFGL